MCQVLLPFVPAAGPDGEAPEPAPESNCTTIAELAISLPLTLSILVEAVIAADLLGFVGDPSTAATVFAPTNDAFVALLEELQLDGLSEIPTDTLAQVLTYHVSDVVALSTDLMDGMEIPTLEGQSLTVDLSDGVVIEGVGSSANVIGPDNIACESVVHVIDTVRELKRTTP